MITPDGLKAAAELEQTFHPKRPDGVSITAWSRRRVTLEKTITEVNALRVELDQLKEDLKSRPF